mmetsp:Transcript_13880/g.33624  ORF Transcript_13880/g.33624 Transcript_13880/m.33624 type:complete len:436 (+) Transcript_13880:133-1440(+)
MVVWKNVMRLPFSILRLPMMQRQRLFVVVLIFLQATSNSSFGFLFPLEPSTCLRECAKRNNIYGAKSKAAKTCSHLRHTTSRKVLSELDMVRNIDLPEALVFYGLESMMEPRSNDSNEEDSHEDDLMSRTLRPGVARLLSECQEVGTAALLLSEESEKEEGMALMFQKAYDHSSCGDNKGLQALVESDDPVLHFRCLNSEFTAPANNDIESSDEYDESIEFYNLQDKGRSPSPAFLLDSLCSVKIDPRGFGGSSGFARGQWIEPRRSPIPARAVVLISGDWVYPKKAGYIEDGEDLFNVKDRCAAARAAGCRIIYLENLSDQTQHNIDIQDNDTQTMSLCDAVIDTFGNDNPRDLQPITLDAISTPGDYWLNPPSPRDDVGNAVAVDDIVEWFRSEREMDENVGDEACVVLDEEEGDDEMSEDEMSKILADLDGI